MKTENDGESRVDAILADLLRRIDEGEHVDWADFFQRNAEFASELRSYLDAASQLNQLAHAAAETPGEDPVAGDRSTHPSGPVESDTILSFDEPRPFGDYELLAEIARGGMGIVYQARQKKAGRTVALKMILRGRLADEAEVRRFYGEAQAAANLDHPNIVPIFDVGQHDGQHYYSMGYVEGRSLKVRLAEGPMSPRDGAELMTAVADAVAYAHKQGVIHRDLKPANILLDAENRPRVTDFGLARQVETDSSLTATGQVMGTPAYMSPEQARGEGHEADARSDIYSLGVVLFELLTGERPFRGSPQMLARQIVHDEPPSPRRFDNRVPRDLETVCLKCLQKEPGRRYQTVQQFQEDLRRWLSNEPVLARPVGRAERLARWCQRNPVVAGLSGTVAAVLLFAAIVSFVAYFRTSSALADAARERDRAVHLHGLARQTVDRYLNRVSEDPRLVSQGLEPLRRELLRDALEFYREFADIQGDEPEIRADKGLAQLRLGIISSEIESRDQGLQYLVQARNTFGTLAEQHPDKPDYQLSMSLVLRNLGYFHLQDNRIPECEEAFTSAVKTLENLVAEHPNVSRYQRELAVARNYLGEVYLKTNRYEQVAPTYQPALVTFDELKRRPVGTDEERAETTYFHGMTLFNLGIALSQLGQLDEAGEHFRGANEMLRSLAQQHPDVPKYRSRVVRSYINLGNWHAQKMDPDRATEAYSHAEEVARELVRHHPDMREFREDLVALRFNRGIAAYQAGHKEEAALVWSAAVEESAELLRRFPDSPHATATHATILHQLAAALNATGKQGEAERTYLAAIAIRDKFLRDHPDDVEHLVGLAGSRCNLANLYADSQPEKSLALLDQAVRALEEILARHGTHGTAQQYLQISLRSREKLLQRLGK